MANNKTRTAGIPRIRAKDPETQRFFDAVTQTLEVGEGVRGDPMDAKVTWRDLVGTNLVRRGRGGELFEPNPDAFPPDDGDDLPIMTIPPAPTGFDGMGAIKNIMLDWDDPREVYRNHSHTEIWRAAVNDRGQAILIGQSSGFLYRDEVGPGAKFYYWIRFVSLQGVAGPDHGVDGLYIETGIDVDYVLDLLEGEITASQLHQDLGSRIVLAESRISSLQTVTDTHATQISQVNTSVNNAHVAIQTEASTRATADNHLLGQYTVKIDNRGHVAGFGLASTSTASGSTTSAFGVRADRFWIASPSDWTSTNPPAAKIPFIVQTTTTTVNGESVAPGVYIRDAFIANGTITRAKIGDAAIDDAKIANLAVDTAKIRNAAVDTLKIAGNAVTVPAAAQLSTLFWIPVNTADTHQLVSVSFSLPHAGQLTAMGFASVGHPNGFAGVEFRLLVNGVTRATWGGDHSITGAALVFSGWYNAGAHTVSLVVRRTTVYRERTAAVQSAGVFAMGTMR